jgi:hypothetical protein
MNAEQTQNLIDRLNQYPKLCESVEAILNIVENSAGDCTKADDAEQHTIDELRQMGTAVLHSWADTTAQQTEEISQNQEVKLHRNGKKKSVGIPPSARFPS